MLTYKNDPKFKEQFTPIVTQHRKDDMVLQGTYGTQNGHWKGCAVACSLRSLDILNGKEPKTEYTSHSRFEKDGLWPEWLAHLEDRIFEGLPQEEALLWPEKVAKAVPVGVDLTRVKWQFSAFLLKENIERVLSLDISDTLKEQVVSAIRQVLAVHTSAIRTGEWDESAASAAWSAASAAWSAAWSAARSAAWSAARSAAWSAKSAAESAESAASAASAAYSRYAKKLLQLLREVK